MPKPSILKENDIFFLSKKVISFIKSVENETMEFNEDFLRKLNLKTDDRINDVMIVLKELGFIEMNPIIKWINDPTELAIIDDNKQLLQDELFKLHEKENLLDLHIQEMKISLDITKKSPENAPFGFVTVNEVNNCFEDETLISIKVNSDTVLKVPIKFPNDEDYKYKLLVINAINPGLIREEDGDIITILDSEDEEDSTVKIKYTDERKNVQTECFPSKEPASYKNDYSFSLGKLEGALDLFDDSQKVEHLFDHCVRVVGSDSKGSA